MATTDTLHKRIDTMLARMEPRLPANQEPFLLCLLKCHLLTDQELERLEAFIEQIEPKIHALNGRVDLSELTDQELNDSGLWCDLVAALEQEDIEAAAKYRRWLNQDIDSLVAAFLAIDETSVPAIFDQAPTYTDTNATYRLYRTQFRSDRASLERDLSQNRIAGHLERMRMWVDTFPVTGARV